MRHLILSHHGHVEYASPVVPMIPEAFVLYYADEIDSKMGAIDRIREKSGGQGWSEYVNLINRKIPNNHPPYLDPILRKMRPTA